MNRRRILIIDDEIGPRESLRILFKDHYDVSVANGGKDGLEIIKQQDPELVILDLKMPEMGGIEVLRQIKKVNQATKVFILTGYGSPEVAQQAQELGVAAYLNKPFDIFHIRRLVAENLDE